MISVQITQRDPFGAPPDAPLGAYVNGSVQLSATAATQIFPAASGSPRLRVVLRNPDASAVIWCCWGSPAAAGAVGSFPLHPGDTTDQSGVVNQLALFAIAAAGTPDLYAEQY